MQSIPPESLLGAIREGGGHKERDRDAVMPEGRPGMLREVHIGVVKRHVDGSPRNGTAIAACREKVRHTDGDVARRKELHLLGETRGIGADEAWPQMWASTRLVNTVVHHDCDASRLPRVAILEPRQRPFGRCRIEDASKTPANPLHQPTIRLRHESALAGIPLRPRSLEEASDEWNPKELREYPSDAEHRTV